MILNWKTLLEWFLASLAWDILKVVVQAASSFLILRGFKVKITIFTIAAFLAILGLLYWISGMAGPIATLILIIGFVIYGAYGLIKAIKRKGKRKGLVWAVSGLTGLLVLALLFVSINLPPPVEKTPTPTDTVAPVIEPTLVFEDDFSNEAQSQNKWTLTLAVPEQVEAAEASITNETLLADITFNDFYLSGIYIRDLVISDLVAEFDAAFVSVKPNLETGIAFILPREQNKDYYVILFKNTGVIEIAKFSCPYGTTCNYDNPMPYCEESFELESGINRFRVYANGGDFRLYANDLETPACEFHDDNMASLEGGIGLGLRGSPETTVSVVFDNVKVYQFDE